MDRFDTMQAFARVVELGSFTKAAASLNLPKATVSAQVQALEARLRVKLLNRTTRHVSVTPDGAAYYERAVRLLSELEEAEAAVSQATQIPRGRLRIDLPGTVARRIVIPALPDFFQRFPEIDLEVGCTDRPVDLIQEGVDCTIRVGNVGDPSLVARRIGDLHVLTCATPAYLNQHGRPGKPADLERHQLVKFFSVKTGKEYEFDFEKDGKKTVVNGIRRVAVNDGEAYIAAGLAGIGVVQLPSFLVQEEIASGQLEVVLGEYLSDPMPVYIVYPQNRHLSIRVRAFAQWVATLFENSDLIQARTTLAARPS